MSYISNKKEHLYLCWYSSITKKTKCKSLKLKNSKRNMQKAKQYQKEFDEQRAKQRISSVSQAEKEFLRSSIKDAVVKFYEINSNKSERTIKTYHYFFKKFLEGTHFSIDDNVNKINKINVEHWILSLANLGLSQSTLHGLTKNLKKFIKFLMEYGYTVNFSINSDLTYKMPNLEIIVFSEDDIQLMLEKVKLKTTQFKITFYTLLFTGLRPSDLMSVKIRNININDQTLRYFSSKTQKYYTVPVTSELITTILPLISNNMDEDKLISYTSLHNIGRAFREFLKEIGLDNKGYTLRTFRKTFISKAHESNVDYATLSQLVGHSNIRTTAKYYTKFSLSKQQDEISKISFYESKKANVYNIDGKDMVKTESNTESLLKIVGE